jgi:predicted ester cyclase
MERHDIEALVQRWIRAIAEGRPQELDQLFVGDASELKARAAAVQAAFQAIEPQIEALLIDGDRVAWRWTLVGTHVGPLAGIAPSGARRVLSGVNFQRVREGRVVEHWTTVDLSGLAAAPVRAR